MRQVIWLIIRVFGKYFFRKKGEMSLKFTQDYYYFFLKINEVCMGVGEKDKEGR